jgi:hypothetical protein
MALIQFDKVSKSVGKLARPVAWNAFFYPDPLKELAPDRVEYVLAN